MDIKEIFTFRNLYLAYHKARLGKRHKKDVILFEQDALSSLAKLEEEILSGKYRIDTYHHFTIYEPKEREIDSIPFRDRIVQHCLVDNYLYPLLERHLIYDNAACRKGKGTDFARKRLIHFMTSSYQQYGTKSYGLKFDIHHYFESIDHAVLKERIRRLVKEDDVYSFLSMVIDSFHGESGKGLPLGNETSQAFGLFCLDPVDRLIKEKFYMGYYVRYMDDGVVISDDRERLKELLVAIEEKLEDLSLEISPKKTFIAPIREGISFLGFRYTYGENGKIYRKVLKKTKRKIRKLLKDGIKPQQKASYLGYLKRSSDNSLRKNVKRTAKRQQRRQ